MNPSVLSSSSLLQSMCCMLLIMNIAQNARCKCQLVYFDTGASVLIGPTLLCVLHEQALSCITPQHLKIEASPLLCTVFDRFTINIPSNFPNKWALSVFEKQLYQNHLFGWACNSMKLSLTPHSDQISLIQRGNTEQMHKTFICCLMKNVNL